MDTIFAFWFPQVGQANLPYLFLKAFFISVLNVKKSLEALVIKINI